MEKKYKIGLWIDIVLTLVVLVAEIMCALQGNYTVGSIVDIAVACLIIYYAVSGYKKPHGNLLKQIMLLFGLSLVFQMNLAIMYDNKTTVVFVPVTMMLIAYIAGRLDRLKENRILMVIVVLNLAHCSFSSIVKGGGNGGFAINHAVLFPLVIWITLCGAYYTRYIQHKEAGLKD